MKLALPLLAGVFLLAATAMLAVAAPEVAGEGAADAQTGSWPSAQPVGTKVGPVTAKHLEGGPRTRRNGCFMAAATTISVIARSRS